jgi:hypothetical protein
VEGVIQNLPDKISAEKIYRTFPINFWYISCPTNIYHKEYKTNKNFDQFFLMGFRFDGRWGMCKVKIVLTDQTILHFVPLGSNTKA